MIHIVNIIPASLSGESRQDSEPNIAVNPADTSHIVATAFTPDPMGGPNAPIYVSSDGGSTWALRSVVPGNGVFGTGDITTAFAASGNMLYAGILSGSTGDMQILGTPDFNSTATMSLLAPARASEDQPWVVATSVAAGGGSTDRVFVGNEDGNQPQGRTATVDVSEDAATDPAFVGAPWSIVGAGDFNGDGKADVLWHNSDTNETQIWFMDERRVIGRGTVLGEDGNPAFVGAPWSIVGAGDFNGDGRADVLWHNSDTNETQIWFMDERRVIGRGTVLGEDGNPAFVGPPWSIVGAS
jgi:hypothetical protein